MSISTRCRGCRSKNRRQRSDIRGQKLAVVPCCHRILDSYVNGGTIGRARIETCRQKWSLITIMKTLSLIMAMSFLVFGAALSRGADLTRISNETGVPVATLQAERTSTGLGWGGLEKAHLLANSSGESFDTIVGKFHNGEGWGKIAHDYGLNLGHVVSNAHRSSHATMHAQNAKTMHGRNAMSGRGKSATNIGRGHTNRFTSRHGFGHNSNFRSGFSGSHGTSMSHLGSSHGMGSMGHGGGHHGR